MLADWQELVWQLHRLPGGAEAAIPDFFGGSLAGAAGLSPAVPTPAAAPIIEAWPLREGGQLCLTGDEATGLRLSLLTDGDDAPIADLPGELLAAARQDAADPATPVTVSPMVLALLAVAAGHVEDGRRLKRLLPRVDGAAKDLMLMTVCRLCG